MNISPLESVLIAGFIASCSSMITKVFMTKSFMSLKQCELTRRNCAMEDVRNDLKEIKAAITTLANRMNLPPEVRDRINL